MATVVGHLPQPVQGAAVISLDGQIYVAGGATAQGTSRTVFRFDPATSRVSAAGELPVPAGYAAAAVTGGIGYLVGGEDGVPPGAHGDDVPAGDGRTDDAERSRVTVAGGGRGPRTAGAGLGSVGVAR